MWKEKKIYDIKLLPETTQGASMAIMSNTLQSFNTYYAM
jgi:hypothetical protein